MLSERGRLRIINIFHLVADSSGDSRILFVATGEQGGLVQGIIQTPVTGLEIRKLREKKKSIIVLPLFFLGKYLNILHNLLR